MTIREFLIETLQFVWLYYFLCFSLVLMPKTHSNLESDPRLSHTSTYFGNWLNETHNNYHFILRIKDARYYLCDSANECHDVEEKKRHQFPFPLLDQDLPGIYNEEPQGDSKEQD